MFHPYVGVCLSLGDKFLPAKRFKAELRATEAGAVYSLMPRKHRVLLQPLPMEYVRLRQVSLRLGASGSPRGTVFLRSAWQSAGLERRREEFTAL